MLKQKLNGKTVLTHKVSDKDHNSKSMNISGKNGSIPCCKLTLKNKKKKRKAQKNARKITRK